MSQLEREPDSASASESPARGAHDFRVVHSKAPNAVLACKSDNLQIAQDEGHEKCQALVADLEVFIALLLGTGSAGFLHNFQHSISPQQPSAYRPMQKMDAVLCGCGHWKADALNFVEYPLTMGLAAHEQGGTDTPSGKLTHNALESSPSQRNFARHLHKNKQFLGFVPVLGSHRADTGNSSRLPTCSVSFRTQAPNGDCRSSCDSDANPSDNDGDDRYPCGPERSNSSPCFPPDLTAINPQLIALAQSINPTHLPASVWAGGHLATRARASAVHATLATVTPPRDLRTQLPTEGLP